MQDSTIWQTSYFTNSNLNEKRKTQIKIPIDLAQTRITEDTDVPPVEPTITIKGGIFAIKGDISFISGVPKSGKSTVSRYILATALMEDNPDEIDTLGIVSQYAYGKPVVYIDSEQPKAYTKRMGIEIKRILGVERLPDNLHLYNWRHHSHEQNRMAIEKLMADLPNAALWVIDGITDFIGGANHEEASNEIIRFFMGVASELNTTIVLLIHENSGGGKMRGHIGSEAERKCGGAITIQKDRDNKVHWIIPKLIRGSADFDKYAFRYDEELYQMVSVDDNKTKQLRDLQDKSTGRLTQLHRLAGLTFSETNSLPKKDILASLRFLDAKRPEQTMEAHRKQIERLFNGMCEMNIITPSGEQSKSFRYLRPIETTQI